MAREYGTKDHWIRPRLKQVLSWIQEGRRLFSRGHIVSGIKSLLIITNIVKEQTAEVQSKINQDVQDYRNSIFE